MDFLLNNTGSKIINMERLPDNLRELANKVEKIKFIINHEFNQTSLSNNYPYKYYHIRYDVNLKKYFFEFNISKNHFDKMIGFGIFITFSEVNKNLNYFTINIHTNDLSIDVQEDILKTISFKEISLLFRDYFTKLDILINL